MKEGSFAEELFIKRKNCKKICVMISKESIETAYCFLHQKQRVFEYSDMDWQKDDIEVAIASYVEDMPRELFELLAQGREDFLTNHRRFGNDMKEAVEKLEALCFGEN